jgi:hypothetical protein
MKRPKRVYDASHIADGVRTVAKLQQRVLQEDPMSSGPLAALKPAPAPAAAEEPEMLAGHCLNCGTKRAFAVEKTETMKNGALRKSGTSNEPGCGHKVSHFVSGSAAA